MKSFLGNFYRLLAIFLVSLAAIKWSSEADFYRLLHLFYDLAIFSGENLSIVYVRRRTASRDTRDDATTCFNSFVRAKDKEQNVKKVTLVLTERFPLQLLGHGAL